MCFQQLLQTYLHFMGPPFFGAPRPTIWLNDLISRTWRYAQIMEIIANRLYYHQHILRKSFVAANLTPSFDPSTRSCLTFARFPPRETPHVAMGEAGRTGLGKVGAVREPPPHPIRAGVALASHSSISRLFLLSSL